MVGPAYVCMAFMACMCYSSLCDIPSTLVTHTMQEFDGIFDVHLLQKVALEIRTWRDIKQGKWGMKSRKKWLSTANMISKTVLHPFTSLIPLHTPSILLCQ
ncbi:hypothetical protein VNO77_25998 [Canavalia gladiata]|uniref:Secreted protein n=1 Tax=Canavalia gladiata TaxID=3824 RepID=A0AAN9Q316_CANGL